MASAGVTAQCSGCRSCPVSSVRLMRRDFRKVRSLLVKGPSASSSAASVGLCPGFGLDLVEADGGLKHEEDIKALFADVFDDARDVLRLRDGLVDRFAKFLDQVFDLLIQCHLRAALWFELSPRIGYSRRLVDRRERHCGYCCRTWCSGTEYA